MMTDSISPRKKFTNDEIIAAITFLEEVGRLTDEELRKRDLRIGEPQKVNHFLSAVSNGESTCLPKQAATLLRLTPLLLTRGSNTVHHVISVAAPKALAAYQQATDLEERRTLSDAIKTAGMVCVDRHLGAIERERRERELALFEPFIGETPEFREAKARFMRRRTPGMRSLLDVGRQPENVVRRYQYGYRGNSREE